MGGRMTVPYCLGGTSTHSSCVAIKIARRRVAREATPNHLACPTIQPHGAGSAADRLDSLTIDNRCGHGKLRFMAKKKISSTDLIWIFHERLKGFDDYPLHGISIAIVPVPSAGWTALTPKNLRLHRPLWENRVRAIEKELRKNYVLKG